MKMILFPRGLQGKFDGTAADGRIAQLARRLPQTVPWSSSSSGKGRKVQRRAEDWEAVL